MRFRSTSLYSCDPKKNMRIWLMALITLSYVVGTRSVHEPLGLCSFSFWEPNSSNTKEIWKLYLLTSLINNQTGETSDLNVFYYSRISLLWIMEVALMLNIWTHKTEETGGNWTKREGTYFSPAAHRVKTAMKMVGKWRTWASRLWSFYLNREEKSVSRSGGARRRENLYLRCAAKLGSYWDVGRASQAVYSVAVYNIPIKPWIPLEMCIISLWCTWRLKWGRRPQDPS